MRSISLLIEHHGGRELDTFSVSSYYYIPRQRSELMHV